MRKSNLMSESSDQNSFNSFFCIFICPCHYLILNQRFKLIVLLWQEYEFFAIIFFDLDFEIHIKSWILFRLYCDYIPNIKSQTFFYCFFVCNSTRDWLYFPKVISSVLLKTWMKGYSKWFDSSDSSPFRWFRCFSRFN